MSTNDGTTSSTTSTTHAPEVLGDVAEILGYVVGGIVALIFISATYFFIRKFKCVPRKRKDIQTLAQENTTYSNSGLSTANDYELSLHNDRDPSSRTRQFYNPSPCSNNQDVPQPADTEYVTPYQETNNIGSVYATGRIPVPCTYSEYITPVGDYHETVYHDINYTNTDYMTPVVSTNSEPQENQDTDTKF